MNKILLIFCLLGLLSGCSGTYCPPETVIVTETVVETVIVEVEKEPETAEAPVTEEADPGRFEIITENEVLILPEACDFTKLTVISGEGKLRDITALADVPHLTELYVESWTLSDISPIGGLTELTDLTLAAGTTNLSPLAGLTKLERLELGANRLDDCSVFAGMTNLRELSLWSNLLVNAENISVLAGLESLEKFRVGGAKRNLTDEQMEMLREVFADIELFLEMVS